MNLIFNRVKEQFKEAKKEERKINTYCWDCVICVNAENLQNALLIVKSAASHANELIN
jgi:hypothetical protein